MAQTTSRVLQLLGLLQSRRVWTGPELAERLGVTTRSVRRDVERLRDLGYPVHASAGHGGGYQLGAGAALLTGFAYAVYVYNGSRATGRIDRFRLYVQTFVWGLFFLALGVLPSRGLGPLLSAPAEAWMAAAYLGIFPTVGSFGLLMLALKRISGTAAAIGSMAEIPFSMFWSWIFLGERVGLSAALGGVLIVASVVLVSTEPVPDPFPAKTAAKGSDPA